LFLCTVFSLSQSLDRNIPDARNFVSVKSLVYFMVGDEYNSIATLEYSELLQDCIYGTRYYQVRGQWGVGLGQWYFSHSYGRLLRTRYLVLYW